VEVLATTAYLYRLTGASHAAVLGVAIGLLWLVGFGDRVVLRLSRRIAASLHPTPDLGGAVAKVLTEVPPLTADTEFSTQRA
jgi:hypothetical protein